MLPSSTAQGGVDYIAFPPVLVDFPSLAQFGSASHTEIRSISLPAVTGEGLERQRDVGQIDGVLVTNPTGSAQIDRFFGDGAGAPQPDPYPCHPTASARPIAWRTQAG